MKEGRDELWCHQTKGGREGGKNVGVTSQKCHHLEVLITYTRKSELD